MAEKIGIRKPTFSRGGCVWLCKSGNLTAEIIEELRELIPPALKQQKTADQTGKTDAERLIEAIDAAVGEFDAFPKTSVAAGPLADDMAAIKASALTLLEKIRGADRTARNALDCEAEALGFDAPTGLSELGAAIVKGQIKHSDCEDAEPNGRPSLLDALWNLAADTAKAADAVKRASKPDRNARPGRANAAHFAQIVVRRSTNALGRIPPVSGWYFEAVRVAASCREIRPGKETVAREIRIYASRYQPQIKRAASTD